MYQLVQLEDLQQESYALNHKKWQQNKSKSLLTMKEKAIKELSIEIDAGDTTITVADATGFVIGDELKIVEGPIAEIGVLTVTLVTGSVLTLDRPIGNPYTTAAVITEVLTNMAVSGTLANPQIFDVMAPIGNVWQITRILFSMVDNVTPDDGRFGGVAALTNGVSLRATTAAGRTVVFANWNDGFEGCWTWGKTKLMDESDSIYGKKVNGSWKIYRKAYALDKNGDTVTKKLKSLWLEKDFLTDKGRKEVDGLIGRGKFYAPKPMEYIKQIVKLSTVDDPSAIVLDFHAGSGTTAHAVLDLNKEDGGNRKFILVEQMDYIETVSVPRVQKVIEQQKDCDFIYCELAKWNEGFIEKIRDAKNTTELLRIWEEMKNPHKSFLNYNVDLKQQDEAMDEFKELSLEKQKEVLVILLDKNKLYVNLSEIDDVDYKISDEDKANSNNFYNTKL